MFFLLNRKTNEITKLIMLITGGILLLGGTIIAEITTFVGTLIGAKLVEDKPPLISPQPAVLAENVQLVDITAKNDRDTCIICMNSQGLLAYIPCGHTGFCKGCVQELGASCPICRSGSTSVNKIFDPR